MKLLSKLFLTLFAASACFASVQDSSVKQIKDDKVYLNPGHVYVAPEGIYINTEGDLCPISALFADNDGVYVTMEMFEKELSAKWTCKYCGRENYYGNQSCSKPGCPGRRPTTPKTVK